MSEASAPSAGVPSAGDPSADAPKSAAARLFDIRSLIGGLFVLYGIMLTVAGSFASHKNLAKASNININLWMGIGMLIVGLLFVLWWRLNPMRRDQPDAAGTDTAGAGGAGRTGSTA
jgi:hypothetical protein